MLIISFERDARHEGWKDGLAQGRSEGIAQGFADGSYQTKLETARLIKLRNFDNKLIIEMTGLSESEVEKL